MSANSGLVGSPVPVTAEVIAGRDPNGNVQRAQMDSSGNLKVAVTGAGSGGTSSVDESAFSAGVSAGTPAMGVYESSPTALTPGQLGILELDADRNLKVNVVAGGAGGGAVTVADGADVALGTTTDAAIVTSTSGTVIGFLRGLVSRLLAQVLDYDTGAGTANQVIFGIALPGAGGPVGGGTATNPIRTDPTGSTTQPVSAASLPLPTGAATAAKQPALGTAGSASADVISVQGVASMTALKVDGSATTQPISGTVTANAGTNLNTSALALETGGNLATIATTTGATTDAAVTAGATGSISAKLRSISRDLVANIVLAAGSAIIGKVGIDQTTPGTTDSVSVATGQGAGATIGTTSGAKVITDANGTLQQYLRGIIYQLITAGASFMTPTPATTGGWAYSLKNGLSNTNSQVKSGQGTLGGWYIYNPNSSVAYVQIFDTATGSITVGSTTPKLSIGIPATSAANLEATCGIQFGTAICVAATTAATNGTAPSSALDCNFFYK